MGGCARSGCRRRAAGLYPWAALLGKIADLAAWHKPRRHATLLYTGDLQRLEAEERAATEAFLAHQQAWTDAVRQLLANDPELHRAASEPVLMAYTRLLQFGDSSSLQVAMPWSQERLFHHCPLDFAGSYTTIALRWDKQEMSFDPWPFGVDHFTVSLQGRVLDQSTFANHAAYQAALAAAPLHTLTWEVAPITAGG